MQADVASIAASQEVSPPALPPVAAPRNRLAPGAAAAAAQRAAARLAVRNHHIPVNFAAKLPLTAAQVPYDSLRARHVAARRVGSQRQRLAALRHPHRHTQAFKLEEQLQVAAALASSCFCFSFLLPQRKKPLAATVAADGKEHFGPLSAQVQVVVFYFSFTFQVADSASEEDKYVACSVAMARETACACPRPSASTACALALTRSLQLRVLERRVQRCRGAAHTLRRFSARHSESTGQTPYHVTRISRAIIHP